MLTKRELANKETSKQVALFGLEILEVRGPAEAWRARLIWVWVRLNRGATELQSRNTAGVK